MTIALKPRWFRFSLLTMFVVMTMVAIVFGWLAYSLNWIRQRHLALEQRGFAVGDILPSRNGVGGPTTSAPGLLWIFRETGYVLIEPVFTSPDGRTLDAADSAMLERLGRLFPEARIRWQAKPIGGDYNGFKM